MKTLFLLLANLASIWCGPHFIRGRPNTQSGMVLEPPIQLDTFAAQAKEYWFDQRLDHFNPADTRTWKQRYFYSDTLHKTGGPVFLQLGGEGEAAPGWLTFGQTSQIYAKQYNALNVLIEHRYYGKSRPTTDLSTENMRFLTSEQALQDIATFIEFFNKNMSLTASKWIVFGGSYSGSLSAWFREKYPHLVAGAIASSAPVEAIVDFQDYLGVVSQSLGDKCDQSIKEATEALAKEMSQPNSWATIQKQFQLCSTLNGTNKDDVSNLVQNLASMFMGIVQYNKIVAGSTTIDEVCAIMADTSLTPLERYAKVNVGYLKKYNQKCLGFKYNDMIEEMQLTSWTSPVANGARQWTYQTCVEFGFYQSSDLKSQPFGSFFPIDFIVKQCADIFGKQFTPTLVNGAIDFTNNHYGGRQPKVSKVVFPNGSVDPWHALGVLKDLGNNSTAILVNGTAHCADMYADSVHDPPGLKDARLAIARAIGQFLQD